MKRSGPHKRYELDSLEPRILLSGDTLSGALVALAQHGPDADASPLASVEEILSANQDKVEESRASHSQSYDPARKVDDLFAGLVEQDFSTADASGDELEDTSSGQISDAADDSQSTPRGLAPVEISEKGRAQIAHGLNELVVMAESVERADVMATGIPGLSGSAPNGLMRLTEILDSRLAKPVFDHFGDTVDPPSTDGVVEALEQSLSAPGDLTINVSSLEGGFVSDDNELRFDVALTATREGQLTLSDEDAGLGPDGPSDYVAVTRLDFSFGVDLDEENGFFLSIREFSIDLTVSTPDGEADTVALGHLEVAFSDAIAGDGRITLDELVEINSGGFGQYVTLVATGSLFDDGDANIALPALVPVAGETADDESADDLVVAGETPEAASASADSSDLTLLPESTTAVELGGLAPGVGTPQIQVTGNANLDGTLDIDLAEGFMPAAGDVFEIMTYGSATGRFAEISGLDVGDNLALIPVQTETSFFLIAVDLVVVAGLVTTIRSELKKYADGQNPDEVVVDVGSIELDGYRKWLNLRLLFSNVTDDGTEITADIVAQFLQPPPVPVDFGESPTGSVAYDVAIPRGPPFSLASPRAPPADTADDLPDDGATLTSLAPEQPDSTDQAALSGEILTAESTDGPITFRVFDSNGNTLPDVEVSGAAAGNGIHLDVSLIDASGAALPGTLVVDLAPDATWTISSANSGVLTVEGFAPITFKGVGDLTGAADNEDTFEFLADGDLTGTLDGNERGFDSLILAEGFSSSSESMLYSATGPDSGVLDYGDKVVQFRGLEPIHDNEIEADRVFTANVDPMAPDDIIRLRPDPAVAGNLLIESLNGTFESISFPIPTNSLTVDASDGNDILVVEYLPGMTGTVRLRGGAGTDTLIANDFSSISLSDVQLGVFTQTFTLDQQDFEAAKLDAATIDTTGFTGVVLENLPQWISQGPAPITGGDQAGIPDSPVTGAIESVVVHPDNNNVVLVGTVGGGIWKTINAMIGLNGVDDDNQNGVDDAGEQPAWFPVTAQFPAAAITAITFEVDNPDVIYAGTGRVSSSSIGGEGYGLLKSADGGQTWQVISSSRFTGRTITSVVSVMNEAGDTALLYVGTADRPVEGVDLPGGLFRSADGGLTFTELGVLASGLPVNQVTSIVVDPVTGRLYAGLPGQGVFLSDDRDGDTWQAANGTFPLGISQIGESSRIVLAVSDVQDAGVNPVYAALIKPLDTELQTSAAAGATTLSVPGTALLQAGDRIRLRDVGELTGDGVSLTFTSNDEGADTIERSSGSWTADGFVIGQQIRVTGAAGNDGVYTISDISPNEAVLELGPLDFVAGGQANNARVSGITEVVTVYSVVPGLAGADDELTLAAALNFGFTADTIVERPGRSRMSGLYRTDDMGAVWSSIGVPTTTEQTYWIDTNNDGQPDPGEVVTQEYGLNPGGQTGTHFSIVADPFDPNVVYVGGDRQPVVRRVDWNDDGDRDDVVNGFNETFNSSGLSDYDGRIFRGDFSGGAWTQIVGNGANGTVPHADSRSMVAVVTDAGEDEFNILQVDDGGIYRLLDPSTSGSRQWTSVSGNLNLTEFYTVAWLESSDTIVGGAQDNGVAFQTATDGSGWRQVQGGDGTVVQTWGEISYVTSQQFGPFQITIEEAFVGTLDFNRNGAGLDTIVRSSGSWLADGFAAADWFFVRTTANAGWYKAVAVSADTITLKDGELDSTLAAVAGVSIKLGTYRSFAIQGTGILTGDPLVSFDDVPDPGPDTIQRDAGSWLADGFRQGQTILVSGSSKNDTGKVLSQSKPLFYTIETISDDTLTLSGDDRLAGEAGVRGVQIRGLDLDRYRPQFVQPYAVNRIDPNLILVGNRGFLFESVDRGLTAGLLNGSMVFGGGAYEAPPSSAVGTVNAIVYGGYDGAVAEPNVGWVGTRGDADGNTLWVRQGSAGAGDPFLPVGFPGTEVRDIAVDPDDWASVFVLDSNGDVWHTTNGDVLPELAWIWEKWTGNLGGLNGADGLQTIQVVRVGVELVVLVGGEGGVFRTINNGAWAEYGEGLPNVLVTDIQYSELDDVLLIGTLGRGAWTIPHASTSLARSAQLTLAGSAFQDDVYYLERNASDPWRLDVFVYIDVAPRPSAPTLSVDLLSLSSISIVGDGDSDRLIVDYGNGPISVAGGISFDGAGGSDTVEFRTLATYTDPILEPIHVGAELDVLGADSGRHTVVALDPFFERSQQVVTWTDVETEVFAADVLPTIDRVAAGLLGLDEAFQDGLIDALGGASIAGIDARSLANALNGLRIDPPRPKDDPFLPVSQVAPESLAQLDNGTSLFRRLIEEGLNAILLGDIAADGTISDPIILRQALDDLDAIPGNVTLDQSTDRDLDGTPDWFFDFGLTKQLDGIIELSVLADALGGLGEVELIGQLEAVVDIEVRFGFGLDSTGFFLTPAPGAISEFTITNLSIGGPVAGSGRLGFIGVDLIDADLVLDPDVVIAFDLLDPGTFGADDIIRLPELFEADFSTVLDTSVVGDPGDPEPDVLLDGIFAISAIIPGFEDGIDLANASVRITWDDINQPQAVDVDANLAAGPEGQAILDFLEYSSTEFIDGLTQLRDQLAVFESELPFLEEKLDTVIDWVQRFQDDILDPLNNPSSGSVSIPTVQEMAAELAATLGISLEDFGLAYDSATGELSFNVNLAGGFDTTTKDIAFSINMPDAIAEVNIGGQADASLDGALNFRIGFDIDQIIAGENPLDYTFIRDAGATGTLEVDIPVINGGARFGFADVRVVNGSGNVAPTFAATLTDPGTNAVDGRIDIREMLQANNDPDVSLVEVDLGGPGLFLLPLDIPLLGISAGPDSRLVLTMGDIDDTDTWTYLPLPPPDRTDEGPRGVAFASQPAFDVLRSLGSMMETLQNMWVGAGLRLRSIRSDLANDERGVTAVEYAVMLVLVAIAILIATPNISSAVLNVFGSLASRLTAGTTP